MRTFALILSLLITNYLTAKTMKFEMPKLPYAASALAPKISEQTINFHYGKHLQTYVNNLNTLVVGTPFESADLETIVKQSEGAIFNNAAQIWNHTFYFNQFSATPQAQPTGKLGDAIKSTFGSFDAFKEQFTKASLTLFGSGWAFLVQNADGSLAITQESNAGNPMKKGQKPLFTCDVWEHAYYIDVQNRRADHLTAFWEVVDWKIIEQRY
ncbi:MAG: superoxide dismutase [Bacteroidales bacterium]